MPTVTKNADGSLAVAMGNTPIRRIDIRDIDKVTFFRNTTENGITTIEINFAGDGSFLIKYDRNAGKLLHFQGDRQRLTDSVQMNTFKAMNPQELQDLLDELEASRASRKRAWENLAEIRWVIKDATGVDLPPPAPEDD